METQTHGVEALDEIGIPYTRLTRDEVAFFPMKLEALDEDLTGGQDEPSYRARRVLLHAFVDEVASWGVDWQDLAIWFVFNNMADKDWHDWSTEGVRDAARVARARYTAGSDDILEAAGVKGR